MVRKRTLLIGSFKVEASDNFAREERDRQRLLLQHTGPQLEKASDTVDSLDLHCLVAGNGAAGKETNVHATFRT